MDPPPPEDLAHDTTIEEDEPHGRGDEELGELATADPLAFGSTLAGGAESSEDSAGKQAPGPEQLGPYRIIRQVGEGGMGEVWEAEQATPVRRRVALKVIKRGMDTKEVVARFDAERQALALMEHPYVAKVFDAGSTPNGRPYFAMEFVHGLPITEYCDRHQLTTDERLELFAKVCAGVQHAHEKAIIHRDLKPSNVLVTISDDRATPKIIDFGVAKATSFHLTDKTLQTMDGALIGTPAYMSPEQTELSGQHLDTRSDVYALGVILYELLVGRLPFDTEELRGSLDKTLKAIREQDPPKPSSLLVVGQPSTDALAQRRSTKATRLRKQIEGDLDCIVMRALEKDRRRRYRSPHDLAEDIRRHSSFEPVVARPPVLGYRLRRFVRRHRVPVFVACASFLFLAVFAAAMAERTRKISLERDRASAATARAEAEAERASLEAESARRVADFLTDLFEISRPSKARGNEVKARELVDRGARQLETLSDQPRLQSRLMTTIGWVYVRLGLFEQAQPLLEKAVAIKRELEPDERDTLDTIEKLAGLRRRQGNFKQAAELFEESIAVRTRKFGAIDSETLRARASLASVKLGQGRLADGERELRELVGLLTEHVGPEHKSTLTTLNDLAVAVAQQGRTREAEKLWTKLLDIRRRVLGPDHPSTLSTLGNVSAVMLNEERFEEAEPLVRESFDMHVRILGEDHPSTLMTMMNLAHVQHGLKKSDEAQKLLERVMERQRAVIGEDHPSSALTRHNLGSLLNDVGNPKKAEPHLVTAQTVLDRKLGAKHPISLENARVLAEVYRKLGKSKQALPLEARSAK